MLKAWPLGGAITCAWIPYEVGFTGLAGHPGRALCLEGVVTCGLACALPSAVPIAPLWEQFALAESRAMEPVGQRVRAGSLPSRGPRETLPVRAPGSRAHYHSNGSRLTRKPQPERSRTVWIAGFS